MSSIFKKQQDYVQKPNRNNFDLSFSNNLTLKLGQITPCLCQEVMPGDRFNINFAAAFRMFPLVFPIQSPIQMHLSFFYVRNRTLWKDWQDFYGRTKDNLVHPYISIPYTRASEIGTGTLADYLGVPTTYSNDSQSDWYPYDLFGLKREIANVSQVNITREPFQTTYQDGEQPFYQTDVTNYVVSGADSADLQYVITPHRYTWNIDEYESSSNTVFKFISISNIMTYQNLVSPEFEGYGVHTKLLYGSPTGIFKFQHASNISPSLPWVNCKVIFSVPDPSNDTYENSMLLPYLFDMSVIDNNGVMQGTINDSSFNSPAFQSLLENGYYITFLTPNNGTLQEAKYFGYRVMVSLVSVSVADVSATSNPFVIQDNEQFPDIKLNALPFRAYEAIYNSYFRNEIVDPFILNGVKEYNRYVTNLNGGADSTTPLYLRQRNYELDFLTSAVPSPQQGIAPLVGVSSTGVFTFEDENGQTFTLTPKIGQDGNTLTGIDSYDEGLPQGSILQLKNMISHGISINDFRNVNSLQRWLETNIRRGFKYKDQILSHWGVNVKYDELDMPEYLGGITRNIDVYQINSQASTADAKLGDYAGQAEIKTRNTHAINHYFDEPGFLIGVVTIVPIPNYSQLLSHYFIKDSALSYPFPEFMHIGYQPISYSQVCPIQAKIHDVDFDDTFGYQRPYVDYVANYDQNHGRFRTDLQGFLLTRNFGTPPQLGHNFITINPSEMTNPFVDTSVDADTVIGQIFFDIKAKRPVAKIVIPRLE